MTSSTDIREFGYAVLDPTLSPWQRRWFHQPGSGTGRRAFTARGALKRPGRIGRGLARWDAACDRATTTRARAIWF